MKKTVFLSLALVFTLTLQYCQNGNRGDEAQGNRAGEEEEDNKPVKMIDYLVGEWKIDSARSGKAGRQTGGGDQTLTFTQEARYILRSGNQKVDSGAFRMNEQLNNLYLESEANEEPREFEVEVKEDTLILSSKEDKGQTVYIYSRSK